MGERLTIRSEEALYLVMNASRRAVHAAGAIQREAQTIATVSQTIATALERGGRVLVCGNGGSAACAQHFAAEFTGKLSIDRAPYAALALTVDTSALTAIANDWSYDDVFARQVTAHARPGDVVVGLSTSGRSANVRRAFEAARHAGAHTVALTGINDELGADVTLSVPLRETARIQEAHDIILHELAQLAERMLLPMADDASADRFPFVLAEEQLPAYREWLRTSGQTLVTTNGAFDLLHQGHIASLEGARAFGDHLVVLINDDASVRALKGEGRPVRDVDVRTRDLERVSAVDHVVLMKDADPRRLLAVLAPDVHAKGSDYAAGLLEQETVEERGGRVELIPLKDGFSTTAQLANRSGGDH